MSDINRLKESLERLGAEPAGLGGGVRRIPTKTAIDGIAGVLREIDATVLGRNLLFTNSLDEQVGLTVSGRRIQRVHSLAPPELAKAYESLTEHRFAGADEPESEPLFELLVHLVSGGAEVSVRSERVAADESGPDVGASTDGLAAAWGLDPDAEDDPDEGDPPLSAFLDGCEEFLAAAVLLEDGDLVESLGDDTDVAQLMGYAEHCAALTVVKSIEEGEPFLFAMRRDDDERGAVIFAGEDSELLVLVTSGANLSLILSLWQDR